MSFSQGGKSRVLIVGAGSAGEMMLRQIKTDNKLGYFPVGIIDDDPNKRHVSIHGIPVLGQQEIFQTWCGYPSFFQMSPKFKVS